MHSARSVFVCDHATTHMPRTTLARPCTEPALRDEFPAVANLRRMSRLLLLLLTTCRSAHGFSSSAAAYVTRSTAGLALFLLRESEHAAKLGFSIVLNAEVEAGDVRNASRFALI